MKSLQQLQEERERIIYDLLQSMNDCLSLLNDCTDAMLNKASENERELKEFKKDFMGLKK